MCQAVPKSDSSRVKKEEPDEDEMSTRPPSKSARGSASSATGVRATSVKQEDLHHDGRHSDTDLPVSSKRQRQEPRRAKELLVCLRCKRRSVARRCYSPCLL